MAEWCESKGTQCCFIDPGSPWQNGWIESFNSRLRDELLNLWQFDSLLEVRVLVGDWRIDYNENRPHSAHGDLTPQRVRPNLDRQADQSTTSRIAAGPLIGALPFQPSQSTSLEYDGLGPDQTSTPGPTQAVELSYTVAVEMRGRDMRGHELITKNEPKISNQKARTALARVTLVAATLISLSCSPGKDQAKHSTQPDSSQPAASIDNQKPQLETTIKGDPEPPKYVYTDGGGNYDVEEFVHNELAAERGFLLTGDMRYLDTMLGDEGIRSPKDEMMEKENRKSFLEQIGYADDSSDPLPADLYTVEYSEPMQDPGGYIYFTATYFTQTPGGKVKQTYNAEFSPPRLIPIEDSSGASTVVSERLTFTKVNDPD